MLQEKKNNTKIMEEKGTNLDINELGNVAGGVASEDLGQNDFETTKPISPDIEGRI